LWFYFFQVLSGYDWSLIPMPVRSTPGAAGGQGGGDVGGPAGVDDKRRPHIKRPMNRSWSGRRRRDASSPTSTRSFTTPS